MNCILKLEFNTIEEMTDIVGQSANGYEGYIKHRIGFNFPSEFAIGKLNQKTGLRDHHTYVIAYIKGDVKTAAHEMYHAKFYIDESHRKKWTKIWFSLNSNLRMKIEKKLTYMGYPESVWIDEYQAYKQDCSGTF
jgi:hypothetical protein